MSFVRRSLLPVLAAICWLALAGCAANHVTGTAATSSPPAGTDAFLDDLERRTVAWFTETTDPNTGLTPDRAPQPPFCSIAAVGFALTAYPIGTERGYLTRAQARQWVLHTLQWFWNAPQGPQADATGYHGFFYHMLDLRTGKRFEKVELSTIDSALLFAGMLFDREYFDQPDSDEVRIRALADSIYFRADWQWFAPRPPLVAMDWKPEVGYHPADWRGYNEAMIMYVLALGSPTHPIAPAAWDTWTSTYQWGTYAGQEHVGFAPLFGHQFSHVWIDFRGIQDAYMRGKGIDYFENSRRATLAQRAYAQANPMGWKDYGDDIWGLTAGDGPADGTFTIDGRARTFFTYSARGADFTEQRDDGTITPEGAGGSMPFAPEVVIPALMAMKARYGTDLYSTYGFVDGFNPTFTVTPTYGRVVQGKGWVDTQYVGIDQGPLLAMVENYRSGLVWKYMRKSPYIRKGLQRAGFTGGWLSQ
ncbi:MAG TPA: glucoamylase family protein [Longimicrobiales bacterium]